MFSNFEKKNARQVPARLAECHTLFVWWTENQRWTQYDVQTGANTLTRRNYRKISNHWKSCNTDNVKWNNEFTAVHTTHCTQRTNTKKHLIYKINEMKHYGCWSIFKSTIERVKRKSFFNFNCCFDFKHFNHNQRVQCNLWYSLSAGNFPPFISVL